MSVWSSRDHNAALEWILNDPGVEEIRSTLLFSIMDRLLEVDPLLAMTALRTRVKEEKKKDIGRLELTKEERELMSSSSFDDTILETAIELLPRIQEGTTKLAAFKEIAEQLIRNDEIDRAFTLAGQIADSDEQVKKAESYLSEEDAKALEEGDQPGLLPPELPELLIGP